MTHFFQSANGEGDVTRRYPDPAVLGAEGGYLLTCNGNVADRVSEENDAGEGGEGGVREHPGTYLVTARNVMKTNERTRNIRESGLGSRDGLGALQLDKVNSPTPAALSRATVNPHPIP